MSTGFAIRISKTIEKFQLSLDFSAANGITAIIGPSGAGKSMLLNTVAGLTKPESGTITLNDKVLLDTKSKINLAPEKRGLGVVFQEARLFPHMTVQKNLTFAHRRDQNTLTELEEVTDLLNLSDLLKRRPHHLSGGEKQRVAIGRALLSAPAALLMDEPLASLDLARRREIMPFLERLRERFSLPILYVSHNLDETIRLADRVIVMDQGKTVAKGSVETVLSRIDVQSLILGAELTASSQPEPVTIVSATVSGRHDDGLISIDTPWGILAAPDIAGEIGHPIRVRVRARDIVLSSAAPEGLSIRNVIAGEIGIMTEVGPAQVDVLVRPFGSADPTPIWARITRRAAIEMDLKPDMPIWALLKAVVLASDIDLDGFQ